MRLAGTSGEVVPVVMEVVKALKLWLLKCYVHYYGVGERVH